MEQLATIGGRVRQLRESRGLSLRAVQDAAGVTAAYLSLIERDLRRPSIRVLRGIAELHNVSVEYLETGHDHTALRNALRDAELELRLGSPAAAAEQFAQVTRDAKGAAEQSVEVTAQAGQGLCAAAQGQHAQAVVELEAAIASGLLHASERPDCFMALGRSYVIVGEPESAIALFERILRDVEHAEPFDAGLFVRFSTYLSYALADTGDTGASERVIMRAAPHAEKLTDTYARVRLIWSLARMHGLKGEAIAAARHYERAIAMLEAGDDNDHLGLAHLGAATVYMDSGGLDEAAQHLDAAERVLSDPDERAHAKVERARLLYLRGDAAQAHELALSALDELDTAPDGAHETGRAWATLAQIQAAIGSDALAEQSYLTALDKLQAGAPAKTIADTHHAMATFLQERGRHDEAFAAMRHAAETLGVRNDLSKPAATQARTDNTT